MDPLYLPDIDNFLHNTSFITEIAPIELKLHHIPLFILTFFVKPLLKKQKMGVHKDANLVVLPHEMSIMLISHGFASHMNLHSSLCRDLASKGVIVISPQHDDILTFKSLP